MSIEIDEDARKFHKYKDLCAAVKMARKERDYYITVLSREVRTKFRNKRVTFTHGKYKGRETKCLGQVALLYSTTNKLIWEIHCDMGWLRTELTDKGWKIWL